MRRSTALATRLLPNGTPLHNRLLAGLPAPTHTITRHSRPHHDVRRHRHVPRTTTRPRRAHRATDKMPGVQLTSSDDHQQGDHGIYILALRSLR